MGRGASAEPAAVNSAPEESQGQDRVRGFMVIDWIIYSACPGFFLPSGLLLVCICNPLPSLSFMEGC